MKWRGLSVVLAMVIMLELIPIRTIFAADAEPTEKTEETPFSVLVNENYEAASIGSAGSGFTLNRYTNPTGGGVIQESNGNKVMELKVEEEPIAAGTNAYVEYIRSNLGGITDTTVVEMVLNFAKYADVTTKICLRSQSGGIASNTTLLQFLSDGSIALYDSKVISGYLPNKEYKIQLKIDFKTKTYDVYINGRLRADGYALQTELENLGWVRVQLGAPPKEATSVYVDDYRIYTSDKVLDDETFEDMANGKKGNELNNKTSDYVVNSCVLLYMNKPNNSVLGTKGYISDDRSITPIIIEKQTMVPFRFFAETVGATVEWKEEIETAVLKKDDITIDVKDGSNEILLNGKSMRVPVGGRIINGVMMAPLSELCDILNLYLYSDEYGVIIYSPKNNDDLGLGWDTEEKRVLMRAVLVTYIFDDHSVEEMMAAVNERYPDHSKPRLIITDERIEEMKKALADGDELFTKIFNTLKTQADSYLLEKPQDYVPEGYYIDIATDIRNAQNRIVTLSGMWRLTGEERYAARAKEELMTAVSQPSWNPYHFMPVGEMMCGVAIGYDWLYNYLTERERELVRSAFVRNAVMPGLDDIDMKTYWAAPTDRRETGLTRTAMWWSRENRNNWDAIIAAGYMMCLMTMTDELKGTELKNTLRVYEIFPSFLWRHILTYAPAGESDEGVSYWDFGLEYMAYYDLATKTAAGIDMGITSAPGMKNTYEYFYGCVGPVADFAFHDSNGGMVDKASSLLWCANVSGNPGAAKNRIAGIMKGKANFIDFLLWTPILNVNAEMEVLDTNKIFTGNAALRSGSEYDSMYVGLHSDQTIPGPSHGHADSGTFVLQSQGEEWFLDLGNVAYGLTNRDNSYRIRPEGHNTVLFNPREDNGHVKSAFAKIDKFESKARGGYAATDLSEVYANDVDSLWRGVKLDNNRTVITVQDEFVAKEPSEFYWFAHTYADVKITVSDDGKTAVLEQDGKKLQADIVHGDGATFRVMEAKALPTSPVIPDDPSNEKYQKLAIHADNVKEMNLTVVFRDVLPGVDPVDFDKTFVPISEWQIEDGEYDGTIPTASEICLNGEQLADFNPLQTNYTVYVDPEVVASGVITAKSDDKTVVKKESGDENGTLWTVVISRESSKKSRVYEIRVISDKSDEYMDKFTEIKPVDIIPSDIAEVTNPPEHTLDNDYSTRWTGKNKPWICYDLGEVQPLRRVGVAFLNGDQRTTRYAVEISKDGENFERIWVGDDAKTLELNYTAIGGKEARYVRIQLYGVNGVEDSWISLSEFKAYGMMN